MNLLTHFNFPFLTKLIELIFIMTQPVDDEIQRFVDRIKCIAFREARDAAATFINRQWIAEKVDRGTRFVSQRWEKSYDECIADYSNCGRKLKLSDEGQNIIWNASGKQRRSSYIVRKEIAHEQNEYVCRRTIDN